MSGTDLTPMFVTSRATLARHKANLRSGSTWLWLDTDPNGLCVLTGEFIHPHHHEAFVAEADVDELPHVLQGSKTIPSRAAQRLASLGVQDTHNSFDVRMLIRKNRLKTF